jgi:ribosomal protein L37E
MTSVKCFHCGSDQDFEVTVGYCDNCGHKLPVPHTRGKNSARQKFMAEQRQIGLGGRNVILTVFIVVAVAAGFIGLIAF